MITQETTTINDKLYCVTLFDAFTAYKLLRKIIAIFSVEPTEYMSKLDEIDKNGDLIFEILSLTTVDSVAVNRNTFSKLYKQNLSEVAIAVIFIIKVNYPDFFCQGALEKIVQAFNQMVGDSLEEKKEEEKKEIENHQS